MKKEIPENIFFMLNGSIGDFLMAVFLMENFHLNNAGMRLHVITPRNKKVFQELGIEESHPYINVIEANAGSISGLFNSASLVKYAFQKNHFIAPSTREVAPLSVKIIGKALTLLRGGIFAGFDDGEGAKINMCNKLVSFEKTTPYHELLKRFIPALGFKIMKDKPDFSCTGGEGAIGKHGLVNDSYVIIHPFGATGGRSYLGDELVHLLMIASESFSGPIVITGSFQDKEKAEEAERKINSNNIKNLCGITLGDTCAIISGAKFYIGVDTGITHLASLLRKKSLVLAKNGNPLWLPYYNENANITYSVKNCAHNIHEGKEHLFECGGGERLSGEIPPAVIEKKIKELFS